MSKRALLILSVGETNPATLGRPWDSWARMSWAVSLS